MKKNYNLFFILVTLLAFSVSCAKSELDGGEGSPVEEEKVIPPDAEAINFSISLSSEEEGKATIASGKVTWNVGDQVTVYGIDSEGKAHSQTVTVSIVQGDNTKANIVTTELSPGQTYYAVFPECETATISDNVITVPEPAAATAQTNSNNQVAVAKAVKADGGYSLQFKNVNHLLKFTVSETFAGTVKSAELVSQTSSGAVSYNQVSFNFGEGTSIYKGTKVTSVTRAVVKGDNYIALAPGITMSDGFCLKLKDSAGKVVKLFFLDNKFTTKRNGVSNINNFETRLYTNLSKDETANCYLINKADATDSKLFCFDATVAGNGRTARSSGDVTSLATASVSHLWSTLNTSKAPTSDEQIVKSVTYHKAGYASFEYASTGNVILAAKNSSGTIIWSWHLWLPIAVVENVVHSNADFVKNMQNANLGALTRYIEGEARDLGFFYQWGRKDPFVGSSSKSSAVFAKVRGAEKSTVARKSIDGGQAKLNKTIQDPTCFITSVLNSYSGRDWYGTSVTVPVKFWSVDKTMYDPCPPGYKVPRVQQGPWKGLSTGGKWSTKHKVIYYDNSSGKTIFFPAAGYLDRSTGNFKSGTLGVEGGYWGIDDGYSWNDTRRGQQFYNYFWYFTYASNLSCAFRFDDDSHHKDKADPPTKDTFTEQGAGRATGRSVRCCKSTEDLTKE